MGASLSWLVCKSEEMERIAALLAARPTEAIEKARFCGTLSPDRLYLFEARGSEWTFPGNAERKRLSQAREVYFCIYEEHVMFSEVACWRDGSERWRVSHDGEKGVFDLETDGELPTSFQDFKNARFKEQEDEGGENSVVDFIFSLPMDLALQYTGYDGGIDTPEGEEFLWTSSPLRRLLGFLGR